MKPCCSPIRATEAKSKEPSTISAGSGTGIDAVETVTIPGGKGLLGTNYPFFSDDGEGPLKVTEITPFEMDMATVTNARFARFVEETGYRTDAERLGNSLIFQGLLPEGSPPTRAVAEAPWWREVGGATWRAPFGPNGAEAISDHPVVHVSWNDAQAFAKWTGGRLPTEAEWEHAARGGVGDVPFPWGESEPSDTDYQPCNIWQGRFPHENSALDGYNGTAPSKSFEPNGYGLFNMIGNVWEMTSEPFKVRSLRKSAVLANRTRKGFRLSKGGSFLCHRSYCYRYRIAARNSTSASSSTSHIGFRVIYR